MLNKPIKEDDESTWQFMYGQIKTLIDRFGPRAPCSETERRSAEYLENQFTSICDSAHLESFECYPRMFNGWPRMCVSFVVVTFAIFLLSYFGVSRIITSSLALGIIIFLFYTIWRQFFCYEEWINWLIPYKKKNSQNVVGIFCPSSGKIKKRVIFAGHYDSSFRYNLIHYTNIGYSFFIIGGVINLLLITLLYILSLIDNSTQTNLHVLGVILVWISIIDDILIVWIILGVGKKGKIFYGALKTRTNFTHKLLLSITLYSILCSIAFYSWIFNEAEYSISGNGSIPVERILIFLFINALPYLLALFFFLGREATPGALDNLSAACTAMGVGYLLHNWKSTAPEKYPKYTEIIILLTGAEEAGDRGAEHFAFDHAEEYNKIDTTVFNLESLTDSALQKIVIREDTTRTKCTPEVYNLIAECAEELNIKYEFDVIPAIGGGTDCAGFIKGGLKCSGLEGIRMQDYLQWYHTDRDDLPLIHQERKPDEDNGEDYTSLNVRGAMTNALKLCMRYLIKKDLES